MNQKKCTVESGSTLQQNVPPDACKLQRIQQAIAAGKTICPKDPVPEPPPAPPCLAVCVERVKNPPTSTYSTCPAPIVCVVEREVTGTARCDAIAQAAANQFDDSCNPKPVLSLPPAPEPPSPCDIQKRNARIAECKERTKRYYE